MDAPVTRDIPDVSDSAAASPTDRHEVGAAVRRFELDPASSPMLIAALAWDTARR